LGRFFCVAVFHRVAAGYRVVRRPRVVIRRQRSPAVCGLHLLPPREHDPMLSTPSPAIASSCLVSTAAVSEPDVRGALLTAGLFKVRFAASADEVTIGLASGTVGIVVLASTA